MYGELIPTGGGDTIQLKSKTISVGRRETNDIVLRFPNISGNHSQLTLENGYWQITDLGSSNGTKVNGKRVQRQIVMPGDQISFARHDFTLNYSPEANGATGPAPNDQPEGFLSKLFGQSLLERAGLTPRKGRRGGEPKFDESKEGLNKRYNLDKDDDE